MSGATSAPAPTAYNLSSAFGYNHDFNRKKCSSMFQKPIAERATSAIVTLPAPNQYDVCLVLSFFFERQFYVYN